MKILVAEDEITTLALLEMQLNKVGYDVVTATDGNIAWNKWNNLRPRILITDWSMPGISGPELCRKIRRHEGDEYTYIIMLTGRDSKDDLVLGMESGADDYMTKPFHKRELRARIKAGERIVTLQDRDTVIFVLAKLAESRDTDTGEHLERIRHYSRILAETMFLSKFSPAEIDQRFVDNIYLTSPLHDIGKVGIPDNILHKPGFLDDREFEIMKTHTQIGFQTINEALKKTPGAEYLKMSADIALNHHEKYDGSGYPGGKRGEEIPLSARIVALADVYDALVVNRVYREEMSHEMAVSLIVAGEGRQFDPMVVHAFKLCSQRFFEVCQQFKLDPSAVPN